MKPKSRSLFLSLGSALLTANIAYAASATWNVNSDGLWSLDGNWNPGAAPGSTSGTTSTDIATFGTVITAGRAITVDANRNIGGINFAGNSSAYTLSGGNLLLTNGGVIQTSGAGSAHTDTISTAIQLQGDGGTAAFTAGSSTNTRLLVLSGVVTGVSTTGNSTVLTLNGTNTGANAVSGQIGNGIGGGTVSLAKSGAGVWNISNVGNSFTGGISLGGGTIRWNENALTLNNNDVTFTANTSFEIFRNTNPTSITSDITVNPGITATFVAPSNSFGFTTSGVLAGGNTSVVAGSGSSASAVTLNFTNAANTFTGQFLNPAGGSTIGGFNVGSLADSAGAGKISMGSGTFTLNGSAPVTLNNRVFELLGTTTGAGLSNNSAGIANTLTVNTNLLVTGVGAKTFTLGGTNLGANTFAGDIAGTGITVAKTGSGTWHISGDMSNTGGLTVNAGGALTLSGTNTYSGNTNFSGIGAQLIFAGSQAASANTSLFMNTNASSMSSFVRFLDDTGDVDGGTATFGGIYRIQSNNTAANQNNFFVGNNNTANGGTSSGTTTGSTLTIGTLNWNTVANNTPQVGNINIEGANGYRLQINDVVMFNGAGHTAGNSNFTNFNPTTANVTLGTVTQATGNAVNGVIPFLVLGGTSSDNRITGAISNASDVGTSLRPVNVTKSNTSTWTLEGTNTYTGATAVTGGLLRYTGDSSAATGAVTVSGGALGGNGGSLGGAVTVSSTGGINLADGSIGNLTLGSTLNITGAAGANNLRFDLGNTTGISDQLSVAGATTVTTTGAAVINLNQLGGSAGRTATTYTLIGGAGTLGATDFAKFSLATTAAYGQTYALTNTGDDLQVVATNVTSVTPAAFWAGGGNNWSTTTNWRDSLAGGGAVAGAPDYQTNVTFSTTTPVAANLTTNVLDTDFNINSLTFTNASGNVTIGGTTRMLTIEAAAVNGNTLGNGIDSQKTSGTNTISAKVGLASSQTWTVATGGTLTVSGAISDFGAGYSLTKAGGGTLNLTGATNYTGGTTITGGILSVNATSKSVIDNSPLSLSGGGRLTVSSANIASASQVSVGTGGGLMSVSGNNSYTTTGKLTGSGTLTLVDPGGGGGKTFNFNSLANDITGGIILNGGAGLALNVNSLADSANNIVFNSTGNAQTTPFSYGAAAIAPLTLATRAIEINSGSFTGYSANITNNNTTHAISIGTNLVATGSTAKTLGLGAVAGPSNIFSGTVTNGTGGGTIGVTKTGAGDWSLTNASNTFTGTIAVNAGTLNYASAGGANDISFTNTNGAATLTYTGAGQTMSGAINASTVTSGTVNLVASGSGAVNYSNTASLGSTGASVKNLVLSGTNTDTNTFAGAWVNNGAGAATLTKNGVGTWELSNINNTYTGATNVNAGKLLINGSTSSTSLVTVAGGATLGGTGTAAGSVSVQAGGTLSPGASIESLNAGALTMASGSTFAYEVLDNSATGADLLAVTGTLTLSNVNLSLDSASLLALAGGSWAVNDKITLISYGGSAITSGFVGYADDTNYTFGSNVWTFNYDDTFAGGNFVSDLTGSNRITLTALTIIPEPNAAALLGTLGTLLLLRRRR